MKIIITFSFLIIFQLVFLKGIAENNEQSGNKWPDECKKIEIVSSVDGALQSAYFFRVKSNQPRPLIVRLHAWSSDYSKIDGVAQLCVDNNYNYIHPDFRGANNRPQACGSPLAVQDIEDAIDYAITHANVDTASIHIIGGSGGGYATLLCYMKTKHKIKTFTAWASITNLVDYYYECAGRRSKYEKYMHDLEQVTSGIPRDDFVPYFDEEEAVKRSPVFMDTPVSQRKNSKLFIFAGIHDGGFSGDVPFTHSLKMFNKIVSDFDYSEQKILFSDEEMLRLIDWQTTGAPVFNEHLSVLIQRQYLDKVQIDLFEGGHEMIPERILDGVKGQNVLVLDYSTGAAKESWVNQLKKKCFSDFIYHASVYGDFLDNQGTCCVQYAAGELRKIDKILILSSINGSENGVETVSQNIKALLQKIKADQAFQKYHPEIFVFSPLPVVDDSNSSGNNQENLERIAWLCSQIKEVTESEGGQFIDIYSKVLPLWNNITSDGIHLTIPGREIIAEMVHKSAWK